MVDLQNQLRISYNQLMLAGLNLICLLRLLSTNENIHGMFLKD